MPRKGLCKALQPPGEAEGTPPLPQRHQAFQMLPKRLSLGFHLKLQAPKTSGVSQENQELSLQP